MTMKEEHEEEFLEFLELRSEGKLLLRMRDGQSFIGTVDDPGIALLDGNVVALKIDAGADGRLLVPWHSIIYIKYPD